MISSGWILPDFYSVYCKSCSGSKEHIKIVKNYLENLRDYDNHVYDTTMYQFYKFLNLNHSSSLDDFSVFVLGWIKISNYPTKHIQCIGLDFQEKLISHYERLGFIYNSTIYSRNNYVRIDISSEILLSSK